MTKLVIAPHVDDDVLGCGGILDADTVTFYCGVDAYHGVSARDRMFEAVAVARRTGGGFYWPSKVPVLTEEPVRLMLYQTDRRVNQYDVPSLIADFERTINVQRPTEVYIPHPSYNQDHRAVYEAALVALRPHDRNHFVPRVLVYEGSQILFWDHATPGVQFHPNYFVPIDMAEKIRRYRCMPSQVREFRSDAHLEALARLRGGEIGVPYAEAFQILRWVGERVGSADNRPIDRTGGLGAALGMYRPAQ
jgi:LmbE family N-acetylglucosaminyl deacetylase